MTNDKTMDTNASLLPCPFCSHTPTGSGANGSFWALHYHHQSNAKCPLEGFVIEGEEGFQQWNSRQQHPDEARVVMPKQLSEEEAVEVMYNAALSDVRKSTHTRLDMQDAYRALIKAQEGK
jgi:hypothetical protein